MNKHFNKLIILVLIGLFSLIAFKNTDKTVLEPAYSVNQSAKETYSDDAWVTVFSDDFKNRDSFKNWELTNRNDYNSSLCNYDSKIPMIEVREGKTVLIITATKNGNTYKSGHLKSNFNFKPAINEEFRLVSNIKLIAQDGAKLKGFNKTYGAWPAFWTVQETIWPVKGEIDIMEAYSYGNHSKFASNIFYGKTYLKNELGTTCERIYKPVVKDGWHKYELLWRNENGYVTLTIKFDDAIQANYTNNSNKDGNLKLENFGPHHIILNLNVGHTPNKSEKPLFDNSKINLFTKTMMWVDDVAVEKRNL